MVEAEYRAALEKAIRTAHENRNHITEEEYGRILGPVGMDKREDELTRGYLKNIGISFGEAGPEDDGSPELTKEAGEYLKIYLKDLETLPGYTEEEIIEAKSRAVEDDDEEAQTVLMNHYLRNVVDIAKLYMYQALSVEDLIGEGNIGLMTAIRSLTVLENADEVDGYVGGLIMDAMDAAIYEDTDIRQRIDEMLERINDINEKARGMSEEMKRPVTAAELSEETGIEIFEIQEALRISGGQIEGLIP
ncbi:MAG: hypothetical protein K6G42_03100 [Lachnospiraceae bacterium]|nr:hypothetical protein [Lachnospiraceae bacterium]